MKYKPYSFTKLQTYKKCPYLFKLKYIDKIKVAPPDPRFFEKGRFYHYVLEYYPELKPFKFKYLTEDEQNKYQNSIQQFIELPRVQHLLEHKFATELEFKFDEDLNPKNVGSKWKSALYGYIDFVGCEINQDNESEIHIIDWKSKDHGAAYPTDKTQLEIYAIWIFGVRPNLQKIICEFAYVENQTFQSYTITRKDSELIKKDIINKINIIENDKELKRLTSRQCKNCDYFTICKPFHIKK